MVMKRKFWESMAYTTMVLVRPSSVSVNPPLFRPVRSKAERVHDNVLKVNGMEYNGIKVNDWIVDEGVDP